ncbi:helix-turn-helix domain-containing protein [Gemmata sp.]|uniref:helix-turn-helix domain-containing protein n=1 Tax=Gemmata sp. TaxID=1914242 RepID=UPI003F712BF9
MGSTEQTGRDVVPGFAEMVKAARESRGWSCAKLGEEAGVSANTVSAVEREVRAPSLRVASALVVALDLKVWLHEPATPTGKK